MKSRYPLWNGGCFWELAQPVQTACRRRRYNRPRPASALPSNASEAGSGTAAAVALASPAMLAVNDEIVVPVLHPGLLVMVHGVSDTIGVTLVRAKLTARGRPRVVMTLEVKAAVSADTAIDDEPIWVSAPSENVPVR